MGSGPQRFAPVGLIRVTAPAPAVSSASSTQLIRAVTALAAQLREAGAAVSPDEIALTAQALALVDLANDAAIADVVRACLVKHRAGLLGERLAEIVDHWAAGDADAQTFDPDVADAPFVVDPNEATTTSTSSDESDVGDPTAANRPSDPSTTDPLSADLRAADPSKRTSDAEVVAAGDGSTIDGPPDGVAMVELPADRFAALAASADDDVPVDASDALAIMADSPRRSRRTDDVPAVLKLPYEPRECREAAAVATAILGARRRGPGPLRRASDEGPVDLTETLRAALRHPFAGLRPTGATKRTQTGRLLVLLDVSRSVRPSTRFTLALAHTLAQHRRTQVVAFVADADDATTMLRRLPIDNAIAALVTGAVVDTDVDSDYPAAFARIVARFGSRVDRWTTVLIIGDGRSVVPDRLGRGPAALRRLARRRATIWWWSPEPEAAWALGAGELAAYVEVVDGAFVVRNAADALVAVEQAARPGT